MIDPVIPSDSWKKERDRIARRIRRSLHVVPSKNPGTEFPQRFDYVVTAARVTTIVEEIMNDTDRLMRRWLGGKAVQS